jgi:transcriptional regulator with XRE-family HTH domain
MFEGFFALEWRLRGACEAPGGAMSTDESESLPRAYTLHTATINTLLKERGCSLRAAARACGVHVGTFKKWKAGKQAVFTDHLAALATFLGCSPKQLIGEEPYHGNSQLPFPKPESAAADSGIKVFPRGMIDMEPFTDEEAAVILNAVQILLKRNQPIPLIGKREGCVELLVNLTPEEREVLKAAIDKGELKEYGVVAVRALPEQRTPIALPTAAKKNRKLLWSVALCAACILIVTFILVAMRRSSIPRLTGSPDELIALLENRENVFVQQLDAFDAFLLTVENQNDLTRHESLCVSAAQLILSHAVDDWPGMTIHVLARYQLKLEAEPRPFLASFGRWAKPVAKAERIRLAELKRAVLSANHDRIQALRDSNFDLAHTMAMTIDSLRREYLAQSAKAIRDEIVQFAELKERASIAHPGIQTNAMGAEQRCVEIYRHLESFTPALRQLLDGKDGEKAQEVHIEPLPKGMN